MLQQVNADDHCEHKEARPAKGATEPLLQHCSADWDCHCSELRSDAAARGYINDRGCLGLKSQSTAGNF